MNIERIKSIAIVVLFMMTILLLYLFWGRGDLSSISRISLPFGEEERAELLSARDVVVPDAVYISLGDGSAYKDSLAGARSDFSEFISAFSTLSENEDLLVEEMEPESYSEAMRFASARFDFYYYMPFSELLEKFGVQVPAGGDAINSMSEAAYSLASPSDLFFMDASDGANVRCYRIAGRKTEEYFAALTERIEGARTDAEGFLGKDGVPEVYYSLGSFLGEGVDSRAMAVLMLNRELPEYFGMSETEAAGGDSKAEYAAKFFGDNFDFVRRIEEESGRLIYMYGYGERTLIAGVDGSFEYRAEDSGSESGVRYFDALDRALRFLADHGGSETLAGSRVEYCLADAAPLGGGRNGYSFCFTELLSGERLRYGSGYPLRIDISGGKVVYFKRDLIETQRLAGAADLSGDSAVNMLAGCYGELIEAAGESAAGSETLEEIAPLIEAVEISYLRDEEGSPEPAWTVRVAGNTVNIGLDEGEGS